MSWQLARLVREQRRASRILAGMAERKAPAPRAATSIAEAPQAGTSPAAPAEAASPVPAEPIAQAPQAGTSPAAPAAPIAQAPQAETPERKAAAPIAEAPAARKEQAVLAYLERCRERLGNQFEVTARDIAERTGLFIGAVPKALAELKRQGRLTMRPSPAGGIVITMGRPG